MWQAAGFSADAPPMDTFSDTKHLRTLGRFLSRRINSTEERLFLYLQLHRFYYCCCCVPLLSVVGGDDTCRGGGEDHQNWHETGHTYPHRERRWAVRQSLTANSAGSVERLQPLQRFSERRIPMFSGALGFEKLLVISRNPRPSSERDIWIPNRVRSIRNYARALFYRQRAESKRFAVRLWSTIEV